jgi:hypothetical protein
MALGLSISVLEGPAIRNAQLAYLRIRPVKAALPNEACC